MDRIEKLLDPRIPVEYIIGSFIVLCLILFGTPIFKRHGAKKFVVLSLCSEYYFLVLCSTVICRKSKNTHHVELMPFWNYMDIWNKKDHPNDLIEVILNIVTFVPIGLLLSGGFRSMKWWHVAIIGCCLSSIIELLQLLTCRGLCETDDVIHNTIGCVMGVVLFNIIKTIGLKPKMT